MSDNERKKEFEFFVDAKKYQTDQATLTGAQIKATAGVSPTYQLFLEEEGEHPDRAISDGDGVSLVGKVKHFFAVPPATFGA